MILLDTSGLLAALFPDQRRHAEAARALRDASPPRLLSPFVLAELDYLVHRLAGVEAALTLLDDVGSGAYQLAEMGGGEVALARHLMAEYRDLGIGLADASIVVLARAHGARDLLTLDARHFRTLPGPRSEPFRLLPADRDG